MKNNIVFSKRNEIYVSSVTISEMLDVKHAHLLRTIEKIVKRQKKQVTVQQHVFSQIFKESTFTNKMNRTFKMYEMNEQAYLKLAMQLSGYEKAEKVQDSIIEAFSLMKKALLNHDNATWLEARKTGKEIRLQETDIIKEFVDYATEQGSNNAKFYYANITKMTNKALELLIQVKEGKPLRDLATIQELGFIQVVENRAMQVLQWGIDEKLPYKFIYQEAKKQINELCDALNFTKQLK